MAVEWTAGQELARQTPRLSGAFKWPKKVSGIE